MLFFWNDVANDAESTQKLKVTPLSLVWRVKQWVNWYIEYQVRVFWYQIYQARLWERLLNRSASLAMSTSVLKALLGKLDTKWHSPTCSILYLYSILWHYIYLKVSQWNPKILTRPVGLSVKTSKTLAWIGCRRIWIGVDAIFNKHVLAFKWLNEYVNMYLQKVCELLNTIFYIYCLYHI